ncbi:unnamed protein product, partial [Vitis vinifera]
MDDGELDFSNQDVFSSPNMADLPSSCSMDSFFDEILKDTHACTHTHTCNPPGPDFSHTHTCFHVHTKIGSTAGLNGQGFNGCDFENIPCVGNPSAALKELPGCGVGNGITANSSIPNKRRRGSGSNS